MGLSGRQSSGSFSQPVSRLVSGSAVVVAGVETKDHPGDGDEHDNHGKIALQLKSENGQMGESEFHVFFPFDC